MLLDCGEGTYGQLRRRYGAASDEIIGSLKCIWISHIHADHHAGLGRSVAPYAVKWKDFCARCLLVQRSLVKPRIVLCRPQMLHETLKQLLSGCARLNIAEFS